METTHNEIPMKHQCQVWTMFKTYEYETYELSMPPSMMKINTLSMFWKLDQLRGLLFLLGTTFVVTIT
jgi:hypothetical protein